MPHEAGTTAAFAATVYVLPVYMCGGEANWNGGPVDPIFYVMCGSVIFSTFSSDI